MRQGILAVVAIAMFACTGAQARHHCSYYRSTHGSMVHVPYRTNHHTRGEMAICRHGTHSVSHHHRGTCSHDSCVGQWG